MLSIYKTISGYGEAPLRAGFILLILAIGLPLLFLASVNADLLTWDETMLKAGLEFIPLTKGKGSDDPGGLHILLKTLSQLAITLQAALFGFALRNRFRR